MRQHQRGFLHVILSIVSAVVWVDMLRTVVRLFRRRRVTAIVGTPPPEPVGIYVRRVLVALVPHLTVMAIILGGYWAIIHFGPLRPVHEWFN